MWASLLACLALHAPARTLVLRTRLTSIHVSISLIPRFRPELASQQILVLLSQETELLDPLFQREALERAHPHGAIEPARRFTAPEHQNFGFETQGRYIAWINPMLGN